MKQKKNIQQQKANASKTPTVPLKNLSKTKTANKDNETQSKSQIISKEKTSISSRVDVMVIGIPLIIIFALVCYLQTLSYGLVNCDDNGIFSNFSYYEDFSNISKAFFEGYYGSQYFRPMVTSSFIIDAQIGGDAHWINHLTNLLLHIVTAIGVMLLLVKMQFKKEYSLLAALLFTVHPLFTNAVGWLNGRNDLLVGMFAVWAFYFFLKSRESNFWLFLSVSSVLYLFSAFSKEVGLVFPAAVLLWIMLIEKKRIFSVNNIIVLACYTIALGIWIYMRTVADIGIPDEVSGVEPLLINLQQIPEFVAKFFFPYNITGIPSYDSLGLFVGLIAMLAIGILVFLIKEKNTKMILFGVFWLLLFLVPGMFKRMNNAAEFFDYLECRAYLPMIGMFFIIGSIIPPKVQSLKNRYFTAIFSAIILFFAGITFFEVQDYKSPITFWEKAVSDNPDRVVNLRQLGMEYQNLDRQDEAEKLFLRALSLNPRYEVDFLFVHLGLVHISRKEIDKAAEMFAYAAEANVKSYLARKNLANAFFELGRQEEAIVPLLEMLAIEPNDPTPLPLLSKAYTKKGDFKSAIHYASMMQSPAKEESVSGVYALWSSTMFKNGNFEQAIEVLKEHIINNPKDRLAYNNLGIAYIQLGRMNEAEASWLESIKVNPDYLEPYNNLLRFYIMNKKDMNKAIKIANEIKQKGGQIDPNMQTLLKNFN